MAQPQAIPSPPSPTATYLRPPAIAATWLGLVTFATGCFFAPRGAEAQPETDDVVGFGCSLAFAAAAAAIVALAIGGRRRWAIELAIGVAAVGGIVALLLIYFLWIDPTLARRHMNLWGLQRLQWSTRHWPEQLGGYQLPLGAGAGSVFGGAAGMLSVLSRRRPGLAGGMALALLFAIASTPGRQFALDRLAGWGLKLRYHLVPWSISDDEISNTAVLLGAIGGAVFAGVALHAARRGSAD
jgi:hypothetical protein